MSREPTQQSDAKEYVAEGAPSKSEKWLKMLEAYSEEGYAGLTRDQIDELRDILDRANTVACAAAGEQFALDRLVFDKVLGIHEMEGNHWAAQLLATSLVGCLEEGGGENYIEVNFNGHPKGPLRVLIQFKHKKTPADIAGERKQKIEELEDQIAEKDAEIADLEAAVEGFLIELGKKNG